MATTARSYTLYIQRVGEQKDSYTDEMYCTIPQLYKHILAISATSALPFIGDTVYIQVRDRYFNAVLFATIQRCNGGQYTSRVRINHPDNGTEVNWLTRYNPVKGFHGVDKKFNGRAYL